MTISHQRIEYLDMARGLAMLAVIWGHIMLEGWSFVFVYSFDIPLFFFLSGMMFNTEKINNLTNLIKRIVRKLLIPYVIFACISWIVWLLYKHVIGVEITDYFLPLKQIVLAYGSSAFLMQNPPLWFVTCLALVQLIYYLFSKSGDRVSLFLCLLCAVAGYALVMHGYTELPWNFEAAMSALLFFGAGNIFVKKYGYSAIPEFKKSFSRKSAVLCMISGIFLIVAGQWNGHITLGSNCFGKSVLIMYLAGFAGIIFFLLLSVYLESVPLARLWKGIRWIGLNSFFCMAVHVPIKRFMVFWTAELLDVTRKAVQHTELYSLIAFITSLLLTICVVAGINSLISMIKKKRKQDK